jgi:hypothetical protein
MWRRSIVLFHAYVDPTPSGVKLTSVKASRPSSDIAS